MGKHVPLPSDPIAKAAEKKRRFAVYRCHYQKRQRKLEQERKAAAYRKQRDEEQAERTARAAWRKARGYDLIGL